MYHKIAVVSTMVLLGLTACGGDDVADALNLSKPQVRFAQIAPLVPPATLTQNGTAPVEATSVAYPVVTDYFDVSTGQATWGVNVASTGASLGTAAFDAQRGHKYTVLALAESATTSGVATINDPTDPSLFSDDARLRVFHGAYNVPVIDVYLTSLGQDIATIVPVLPAIAFKTAAPTDGTESLRRANGGYRLVVTLAGSKAALFQGRIDIADNNDVLIMTVPNASDPAQMRVLVKVQGVPGATEVAAL